MCIIFKLNAEIISIRSVKRNEVNEKKEKIISLCPLRKFQLVFFLFLACFSAYYNSALYPSHTPAVAAGYTKFEQL